MAFSFESLLGIALGIGLAAAAGFRIFVPLLVAGLVARFGHLPLAESFQWLATTPALIAFATACAVETLAYFIPGLDHALDVLAGPATVVAGILVSAAVMTDLPPGIMWPVAVIAGGGTAGLAKGGTALLRAQSGAATGGLANPLVAGVETLGAAGLAILAIVVPIVCLVLVIVLLTWSVRRAGRLLFRRRRA
jgi:hypothetical protein